MPSEHEGGYGRPPKSGQFKPGRSGNPKGRPKHNLTLDVSGILNELIPVSLAGKSERMHPIEAHLRSLVAQALRGSMRAAADFLLECGRVGLLEIPEPEDDHCYVIRIPKDWDQGEWMAAYVAFGPPPWKGERDGLIPIERR